MVLAQPKDLEAELVGELDLLEQLAQALRPAGSVSAERQVGEGGKAQFHKARLASPAALYLLDARDPAAVEVVYTSEQALADAHQLGDRTAMSCSRAPAANRLS